MLIFSPLLLWTVAMVLIGDSHSVPQTNAQVCQKPDQALCVHLEKSECSEAQITKLCPMLCTPEAAVVDCPPPWSCVGGRCLQVITSEGYRIWPSARAACVQLGSDADLAVVPNIIQDRQALGDYIRTVTAKDTRFWLGGSNYYETNEWKWINGKTIEGYTSSQVWSNECIYIDINNSADKLKNEGCYATLDFVCEKKK